MMVKKVNREGEQEEDDKGKGSKEKREGGEKREGEESRLWAW